MKRLMPKLRTGLSVRHKGKEIKLLYLTETLCGGEVWRIVPIGGGEHQDRFFARGEHITILGMRIIENVIGATA
jgi:hypothetical protein